MSYKLVREIDGGGLICFLSGGLSSEYDQLKNEIEQYAFCSVVLMDECAINDLELLVDALISKISTIHFNCSVEKETLQKVSLLREEKQIRDVGISLTDYYKHLNEGDYSLIAERWDYGKKQFEISAIVEQTLRTTTVRSLMTSVENVVKTILSYNPMTDIERIILFDLWMQKNIQYIKAKESPFGNGYYFCPGIENESTFEDVLINHYGKCEDIAFTASLVLNHPKIGIKCRMISSSEMNHAWNVVTLGESEYYYDFTHNITRNPNKVDGALKAKSYSSQFTLLGSEDAFKKYGQSEIYDCSRIAKKSLSREEINRTVDLLSKKGFSSRGWDNQLVMESCYINERGGQS